MIRQLSVHHTLFKPTIILDAGIATEENLAWLRKHKYFYVVSARQDAPSLEFDGELVPVGDAQDFVKAALLKNEDGRTLHYRSSTKAKGEQLDLYFGLGLSSQILGTRKIIL